MRTLLNQIEQSLSAGFYYLSLMTALSIPDIDGALALANGEASGQKYAEVLVFYWSAIHRECSAGVEDGVIDPK